MSQSEYNSQGKENQTALLTVPLKTTFVGRWSDADRTLVGRLSLLTLCISNNYIRVENLKERIVFR